MEFKCNICGKTLPEKDFYINRSKKRCKKCVILLSKNKAKLWRKNNKDKIAEKLHEWKQNNKLKHRLGAKRYYYKHKLESTIRSGIYRSLKHDYFGKWQEVLGYDLDTLKKHLEKQFTEGMTWDNYGKFGWHIDHIKPINTFNITDQYCDDFKKCWALTNLRPLWWKDNLIRSKKGDL